MKFKKGYTIVEVLLSMSFISLLMLLIGIVSLQMINIYRKGISLKAINITGQLIIDDFTRAINASSGLVCLDYRNDVFYPVNCLNLSSNPTNDRGGAICTGKYSYLWNYGDTLLNHSDQAIKVNNKPIRLYKVNDQDGVLCQDVNRVMIETEAKPADQKKELLGSADRDLALHSLAINSEMSTARGDQTFYNLSFVLGTFQDQVINTSDASCKTPTELANEASAGSDVGDFSYCAINKFNFSARTISGKGRS